MPFDRIVLTALVLVSVFGTGCKGIRGGSTAEAAILIADSGGTSPTLQVDTPRYEFRKNESNDRRIELPERKPSAIETSGFVGFPGSSPCSGCTLVIKYSMDGGAEGSLIFSASATGISFESYPRSFESDFSNPDEKADTTRQLKNARLQSIHTENTPESFCKGGPCKVTIRLN
jgi:hypothetical protein